MQPATNVIPFPIIPRKPADRRGHPRVPGHYLCTDCGNSMRLLNQSNEALYCGCGAEMRPVGG